MKWKGGRQSTNVQDETYGPPQQIQDGDIMVGGQPYDSNNPPSTKQQPPGIIKTQVTPGVWKTFNSI